ncbi:MAG: SusC/RagA family TonB-linked outer membrane protein [Chitinophagaceae bacterium]|nr:SusC/RagA family TonB-linked outer membrane protein [Chitinophagaceae bacterium]
MAKIFSIIMLAGCLQLSASGYSQNVTLSKSNVSLVTVFQEMQKQTGFNFLYTYEDLERAGNINVDLRNIPIWEAVAACLRGKPLTFSIVDRTIVIKYNAPPAAVLIDTDSLSATITVRGHVADSTGAPLSGATVMIKGTTRGTKTNVKGDFEMREIPSNAVLVISFTGYIDKEVIPNTEMSMYVVLKPSLDILDATVIQAYGTTSRRFNVGSIATVDAATISRQPVTNVLLALQGQAPGLAITSQSGVPGSRVLVQLRGQNTLLSNPNDFYKPYNQPLFIIDGVPFAPQNDKISKMSSMASAQSSSGGIDQPGGLSPFNSINPSDIESVSILKDADATSIYGTQGSNGVILITTKKGKPGKSSFNLSVNSGFNTNARKMKMLNTQQYLDLRKAAFAADGITPGNDPYNRDTYAPDITLFDQHKYTDWQKLIYGKTSNNTDVHASLSGGSYTDVFLVSAGYTRSNFNFPGDFSDQRLSFHTNLRHTSADNHLTVEFGTDYSYDRNNSAGIPPAQRILSPPNTPDLLDAQGNLVWNYKGYDLSGLQFYAGLKQPVQSQSHNVNNTLRIGYKILSSLNFTINMGYNRFQTLQHTEAPAKSQSPAYAYATASFSNNTFQTINVEPQLDYANTLGKGNLSVLVGATYKKNLNNGNTAFGYGYVNDNLLGSINGAASISSFDDYSIYKYAAGFARIRYIYDQKYILTLGGRRDGSSNFGPGNQFGNFGSVAAGWIFSEERLFRTLKPVLSFGKLYGSYGTSGSDGVQPYNYQSFWAPVNGTFPFQGVRPNFPVNLYNPDYSWALKKSLNISMDLGFFNDRLFLNATWYRNREGQQLAGYPLPAHVGFPSVVQNVNTTIQNSGWEFSLNSTNVKRKDLTWTTNFNISFNRNKLVDFPNLQYSSYKSQYVIGQPVSVIIGNRYKGVNPTTGLFEYYTKDGDVTNTPNYQTVDEGGDRMPIANREVKYMGGIGNTLTYKNLSLSVFFQFSSQMAPTWLYTIYSSYWIGTTMNNMPVEALSYWKHPGDQTRIQKLSSGYGSLATQAAYSFSNSSGAYAIDTYLRLKTLSLSYSLPESLLKKWHVKDCRVYANAQNLLTITNYKVTDPEQFNDFGLFPIQRIVACGLSFNF